MRYVQMITPETLLKFAPKIKDVITHSSALEQARKSSTVTTLRRLHHIMGQIFVETAGFTAFVENLNYKNPERFDAIFSAVKGVEDAKRLIKAGPEAIANRVYANRLGNGSEDTGDGWKYRGSGYKQLTGKKNYLVFGNHIGHDLVNDPDLAREPFIAAKIAFKYWDINNCSAYADKGDTEKITLFINGPGCLGLKERQEAVIKAMSIWR